MRILRAQPAARFGGTEGTEPAGAVAESLVFRLSHPFGVRYLPNTERAVL
jgi:hypothetical protein